MGMGFSWDLYLGTGFYAGSISICQGSTLAIQFGRNLDIGFALPISADYPVVFVAELDDFFRLDRYGGTGFSRGLSKRPGPAVQLFKFALSSDWICV